MSEEEEEEMIMSGAAIGIDLGTTNSAVAVHRSDGRFVVVPPQGTTYQSPTFPSVVAFNADGKVLCGPNAAKVKPSAKQAVFKSVKRLLGRSYAQAGELGLNPYKLGADPMGKANDLVRYVLPDGRRVLPQYILAELLKELRRHAEHYLGTPVTRATMGVPANYGLAQMRALEEAAAMSGLMSVVLVREPELAVRTYGVKVKPGLATGDTSAVIPQRFGGQARKNILVVDIGGGTFDVTVVRESVLEQEIRVLGTDGDQRLGGDDFDDALEKWAIKELKIHLQSACFPGAWPLSKANRNRLRMAVRKAKEQLSTKKTVFLEFAGASLKLTRLDFNRIALDVIERMLQPIRRCCVLADISLPHEYAALETMKTAKRAKRVQTMEQARALAARAKQIEDSTPAAMQQEAGRGVNGMLDEIICVGAASWTPAVQDLLTLLTGIEPKVSMVDPETAVAMGAAVSSSTLDQRIPDVQVHSQWRAMWTTHFQKSPQLRERLRKERQAAEEETMRARLERAAGGATAAEP